jgi:hypothetical protein
MAAAGGGRGVVLLLVLVVNCRPNPVVVAGPLLLSLMTMPCQSCSSSCPADGNGTCRPLSSWGGLVRGVG